MENINTRQFVAVVTENCEISELPLVVSITAHTHTPGELEVCK
jgi:hypothetical protein